MVWIRLRYHRSFQASEKLTDIEQMAIALIHPFMKLYRLEGGSVAFKGQILNVEEQEDITEMEDKLPLRPDELPYILI